MESRRGRGHGYERLRNVAPPKPQEERQQQQPNHNPFEQMVAIMQPFANGLITGSSGDKLARMQKIVKPF